MVSVFSWQRGDFGGQEAPKKLPLGKTNILSEVLLTSNNIFVKLNKNCDTG